MKKRSGLALAVGLAVALLGACSAGDEEAPAAAYKYFGYVANPGTLDVDGPVPGSGRISAFEIDPESGRLTVLAGSPFAGANQPRSLVAHPSGKYVYVTDADYAWGQDISASAVDPTTGTLTVVPGGSAFVAFPGSVGIDPKGNFIYVAGSGHIYAFAIDPASGALAEVPGSPFVAENPNSITVDPAGKFVYALSYDPESYTRTSVRAFAVDPASGALTEVAGSPFAAGSLSGLAVHPGGKFVYVSDHASSRILRFVIDPASGALTEAAGSPLSTSNPPGQIEIAPSGEFAYVVNSGLGNVAIYRIDLATGALTEISGSPFTSGSGIHGLNICPSGNLALSLWDGRITIFRIVRETGALAEIPGSPLVIGASPRLLAIVRIAQQGRSGASSSFCGSAGLSSSRNICPRPS